MPCYVSFDIALEKVVRDLGIYITIYNKTIRILAYADDTSVLKEAIINLSEAVKNQSAKI
jgi:hypothetical protein